MLRTQIYLEEEQILKLKFESKRNHTKISELIRTAIDEYFLKREKNIDWKRDLLNKAIGTIELDVADAAENPDKYLYGQ